MKGYRETRNNLKIKADVFTKVLKHCSKLSIITSDDTNISSCDFYRLLGVNHRRFDHVNLLNATKEEVACFMEAPLNPRTHRNTEGIVDRHPEEETQIIEMLSDEFARVNGGPIFFYENDARMVLRNS
jgi:hypothetical protein